MKIKTSELTGAALDWAVDEAQGYGATYLKFWNMGGDKRFTHCKVMRNYSESWEHGGPIIERERLDLNYDVHWVYDKDDPEDHGERWYATPCGADLNGFYGSTPLIAAMRCFVASKLGDEVDVPKGLS